MTTIEGLPPGPRTPALLNSMRYLSEPARWLRRWRAAHGDLFTLRTMNGVIVCACTPELAQVIYAAPPDGYAAFAARALGEVFGDGSVMLTDGARHRRQRKLISPPFRGDRMRAYGEAMRDATRRVMEEAPRDREVQMHALAMEIGMEVICRTVFGVDEARRARRVLDGLVDAVPAIALFVRAFQTGWFPPWRDFQRRLARFDAFVEQILAARRAGGPDGGDDILSLLLSARTEDGEGLDDEEIRAQLISILAAGHETTATAIAWLVHDLLGHPDALARVRAEVDALGDDPAPEALAKLPYLDAAAVEILRHRTVVSDNPRVLLEPLDIGGYRLPEGVCVGAMFESIHVDPALYDDPLAFRPERFLGTRPAPFAYLPFGGGHRRCLGAAFSDYELRIAVATIVGDWDLERVREDRRERRNVTMAPKHGAPLRVRGRRREGERPCVSAS
jgi:cytochrome P450